MKRAEKRHQLVEHYLDFYSTAMAMLKDCDDAQDAVQEAIVRTLVRRHIENPTAYCMQTVKHLCIDILRHRGRLHSFDEMAYIVEVQQDDLILLLQQKKKELSRVERAILELHYEEGYTIPEVAAMLGLSPATLKRVMAAAKDKLKKQIEPEL